MSPQQRYYRKNKEKILRVAREKYACNIENEHVRSKKYTQKNKNKVKIKRNQALKIKYIIPQTKLLYTSMEDDNFKKCWAINNLRPLSSKANFLKGHK